MNLAIRHGSIGAMALAFVLCLASVGAADVPCCLTRARENGVGGGCAMEPTRDSCASRGGQTATSCRACISPAPMIQQPGGADGDGDSVSDVADETVGSDLADASDAAQPGSPWTLLVAAMFLAGL